MLIDTMIKQAVFRINNPVMKTRKISDSFEDELAEYVEWVFENPELFSNSQRELYTLSEIMNGFNKKYGNESRAINRLAKKIPESCFAINSRTLSVKIDTPKSAYRKMVAIKNHSFWNTASRKEAYDHLLSTMS